jgi:hypothetical protein
MVAMDAAMARTGTMKEWALINIIPPARSEKDLKQTKQTYSKLPKSKHNQTG